MDSHATNTHAQTEREVENTITQMEYSATIQTRTHMASVIELRWTWNECKIKTTNTATLKCRRNKKGGKNHPGKKLEMVHVYNKNMNKRKKQIGVAEIVKIITAALCRADYISLNRISPFPFKTNPLIRHYYTDGHAEYEMLYYTATVKKYGTPLKKEEI